MMYVCTGYNCCMMCVKRESSQEKDAAYRQTQNSAARQRRVGFRPDWLDTPFSSSDLHIKATRCTGNHSRNWDEEKCGNIKPPPTVHVPSDNFEKEPCSVCIPSIAEKNTG
jgi:hypothetical protein